MTVKGVREEVCMTVKGVREEVCITRKRVREVVCITGKGGKARGLHHDEGAGGRGLPLQGIRFSSYNIFM